MPCECKTPSSCKKAQHVPVPHYVPVHLESLLRAEGPVHVASLEGRKNFFIESGHACREINWNRLRNWQQLQPVHTHLLEQCIHQGHVGVVKLLLTKFPQLLKTCHRYADCLAWLDELLECWLLCISSQCLAVYHFLFIPGCLF